MPPRCSTPIALAIAIAHVSMTLLPCALTPAAAAALGKAAAGAAASPPEHGHGGRDDHGGHDDHGADDALAWTAACACGCDDAPASGGLAARLRLGPPGEASSWDGDLARVDATEPAVLRRDAPIAPPDPVPI